MGKTYEKMSWDGKVADNPKPFGRITSNNEPVTTDQLAQVEENILKTLDELYERLSQKDNSENNG
jgi:hypothetical protein